MTTDDPGSRGFSLTRWSQRKLEAARSASAPGPEAAAAPETSAPPASAPSPATPSAVAPESTPAAALPPIESLTIDSDFSVFLGPRVDPAVKLGALKKLFRDPRFNVMDGLDVYIDDYSVPDPLAPELARTLAHARYVFAPPRTRVNEAGIVEDVPDDEATLDSGALPPASVTIPPEATTPSVALNSDADPAAGEAKPCEGSEGAPR
jgi:hypothetical protein